MVGVYLWVTEMIKAMVDVLKDPRVWTHNTPNVPNTIEAK